MRLIAVTTIVTQVKRFLTTWRLSALIVVHTSCAMILFDFQGRAVQTARSLDEGLALVLPLDSADVSNRLHDGKLIHLTGTLRTGEVSRTWCIGSHECYYIC